MNVGLEGVYRVLTETVFPGRANTDPRVVQFDTLEVKPTRADVETLYLKHANVSLPDGTNRV